MQAETKVTDRSRWVGALLIATAVLVNRNSIGWLISADKVIASDGITTLILLGQAIAFSAGLLLIMRPNVWAVVASIGGLLSGLIGVIAVVGIIGTLGWLISPPTDFRYWTYPEFSCSPDDEFCNTAESAGLKDVIRYGKGTAFADIDGDGWVDLYAGDAEARLHDDYGVSAFYLNNGDGTFRPVDLGIADKDLHTNWNGSFADFDNDGDQDLVMAGGGYAGFGRLALYENRMQDGEGMVAVTESSGLEAENAGRQRWWGLSWADYDGDRHLDFAVSRLYAPALLFHNNGDGTFTNVTEQMGIESTDISERDGKNVVWVDYDNDGDLDVYFAGIQSHNFFENLEGKYFIDVTEKVFAGLIPENRFYTKGAPVVFAAAAADFDQDGDEDIYLGRQIEQELLLINDGSGKFTAGGTDIGLDTVLRAKNSRVLIENTMGLGVGDLQDDGWPDVIVGSGDPVRADMDVIFCNRGGRFERCTELLRANGDGEFRTRTHGVAFADVNQDGATDVFQNLGGHSPWDVKSGIDSRERSALFVRNKPSGFNTATLLFEGTKSNRDGIGARVRVTGDGVHYYTVRSTQAFQSQNDSAMIVTLGAADQGEVEVRWPSGEVTVVGVKAGDRLEIRE